MWNINRIIITILTVHILRTPDTIQCKDSKNMLKTIENYTNNGKQRLPRKLVPISYLPNFEDNQLEYPGKNYTKLKIIKEKWDNYYKCLNEQALIYEERDHMIPLIATMSFVGTTLTFMSDCFASIANADDGIILLAAANILWESNPQSLLLAISWNGAYNIWLECGICQSPIDRKLPPKWYNSVKYTTDTADILPDKETNLISHEDSSLNIFNIQHQDAGLYYCYFKQLTGPNYFIHVADDTEPTITVWPSTAPKELHQQPEVNLQNLGVIIKTEWSKWTNCNRCGHTGRRKRYGACIVVTTLTNKHIAEAKDLLILYYFKDGIPCRSRLLPNHILQNTEVYRRPNEIMISYCKVPCKEAEIFVEYDEETKTKTVFNNSEGVFSLNELLPPLKPLPERTTVYAQYHVKTTICCPGNLNTDTPVLWAIGLTPIYGPTIKNQTNGRITINDLNQIVFEEVNYKDVQTYSCWQDKDLAGTVHLIVFQPSRTRIYKLIVYLLSLIALGTVIFVFYKH